MTIAASPLCRCGHPRHSGFCLAFVSDAVGVCNHAPEPPAAAQDEPHVPACFAWHPQPWHVARVIDQTLDAMETGATHEKRRKAWDALRDLFYPAAPEVGTAPVADETPASTWLAPLLHGWACQIAARFNSPVWLVGSALREVRPRDVDVIVTLPDEQFFRRYGLSGLGTQMIGDARDDGRHTRYWQDMAKLTGWADFHHGNHSLNLDFKVQDESQVSARRYDPSLRVRLDTLTVPVADETEGGEEQGNVCHFCGDFVPAICEKCAADPRPKEPIFAPHPCHDPSCGRRP